MKHVNYIKKNNPYISSFDKKDLIKMLGFIKQGYKTTFTKNQILTYLLNKQHER